MTATLRVEAARRTYATSGVKVETGVGKHDMLTVSLPEPGTLFAAEDQPISLHVAQNRSYFDGVGIVDTVLPLSQHGHSHGGLLFALGPTAVLRSGQPRVWQSQRPFDIASSILDPYGLGLEMDAVPGTIPFLAQSAQSDWEMLKILADRCGLSVFTKGTVVRMVNLRREIRRQMGEKLPTLEVRFDVGRKKPIGNVEEFVSVVTSTPLGFERREFVGVDKHSGNTFKVIANEDSTVTRTGAQSVATLAEALAAKERFEQRRYNQLRCVIKVWGNLHLLAGSCVLLTEEAGDRFVWIVLESVQELDAQDKLTTILTLCRSADDAKLGPLMLPSIGQRPMPISTGKAWRSNRQWRIEL